MACFYRSQFSRLIKRGIRLARDEKRRRRVAFSVGGWELSFFKNDVIIKYFTTLNKRSVRRGSFFNLRNTLTRMGESRSLLVCDEWPTWQTC